MKIKRRSKILLFLNFTKNQNYAILKIVLFRTKLKISKRIDIYAKIRRIFNNKVKTIT